MKNALLAVSGAIRSLLAKIYAIKYKGLPTPEIPKIPEIGTVFKFAAPDDWAQFQDGARHVFHGPNGEELIVSGSVIRGTGTTANLSAIQQQLFENAKKSATKAAAHPDLQVIQPLAQQAHATKMECWTLLAQTQTGDILFYEAIFRDPRGVLLATLEAPNTIHSKDVLEQFIKSVEAVSEGEARQGSVPK